ncbi:MAG TPA: flagellar hook-associated protein FlgK [Clostridiaceae bacterium]|nr:flagellar hook-associated protein FlgK [Clostridiaceae bacterium]
MASGLGSYNIAISGLYVNERALDVTGHNISNVNTPGYVRQQAMIKNAPYINVSTGSYQIQQMGLGADLQQIRQIRNSFLDAMYRKENMTLGYWEARYKGVQEIESILADPMGEGLQDVLNDFWDAWQELSKEPESLTVRAIVRQRSQNLVHTINHIGSQLDKLIEDLNTEISVRLAEVNSITAQIAELNVKISSEELAGGTANDYRDQRNLLADRLTKLVNAEVSETEDKHMYITIEGFAIVKPNGNVELHLETEQNGTSHKITIGKNGVEAPLNNGYIKGLIDTIKEIEDVKEMLNKLVSTMAEEVNKLHRSGKTAGEPPADGQDFFVSAHSGQPITISNIKLNDNLKDLNNIVSSAGGGSGDNTIALAISGLRNKPIISDKVGTLSIDEYYETVILAVGHSGKEAFNILDGQTKLVQSIDNNRQSLSGVSLDEEMANMMKYRFAYEASSRAFNAIDNMIETIINRMGIVGR